MKKLTLILALLLLPAQAFAIVTYNCDRLTGGVARDLDYMSVSDLNNGDRAIVVTDSGSSVYYHYFRYDASGTTAQNTATHPYHVRPVDYAESGVWVEVSVNWVEFDSSLTLDSLTVTNDITSSGTFTVNEIAASGKLSGGVVYHRLIANLNPVAGITLYGGYITGVSEPALQSGMTVVVPSGTGAGENLVFFNERNTYTSGTTLNIHFTAGDTIRSNQTITAGTSKFVLFGDDPWDQRIVCISGAVGEWTVLTTGNPTVDWD